MTTIPSSSPDSAPFPAEAVEACLRAELIEIIKADASIKGMPLTAAPAQLAEMAFDLDSLVVISILCAVESIIEFELPESVVRAGGYASVERALGHLLPRIEQQWLKQKGAKS